MDGPARQLEPPRTVRGYVRANIGYWGWRWAGIGLFCSGLAIAKAIGQSGFSLRTIGLGLVAAAIAYVMIYAILIPCLLVGGWMHVNYITFPEWMTRRRGE